MTRAEKSFALPRAARAPRLRARAAPLRPPRRASKMVTTAAADCSEVSSGTPPRSESQGVGKARGVDGRMSRPAIGRRSSHPCQRRRRLRRAAGTRLRRRPTRAPDSQNRRSARHESLIAMEYPGINQTAGSGPELANTRVHLRHDVDEQQPEHATPPTFSPAQIDESDHALSCRLLAPVSAGGGSTSRGGLAKLLPACDYKGGSLHDKGHGFAFIYPALGRWLAIAVVGLLSSTSCRR